MFKPVARSLLILLIALPSFATARPISHKLQVMASFSIIADMAKEVGGDYVEVQTLVPAGSDVHVYEPSPSDARALASADVVLINGLGFEHWIGPLLQSAEVKGPVVTVSKGVIPIMVNGDEVDPHAWQDLSNGMIYVDNIRDALVKADPSHAGAYRGNAEHYLKQLIELDRWVKVSMDELPADCHRAITTHDAVRYFARTYHFNFTAVQGLSTDSAVSAQNIAGIIDQIRREHVKALFLENMANPELIEQLADDSGATVGGTLYSDSLSGVYDDGGSYMSMFRHNVRVITEAMRK